jgi:type VI secretion system protein ImpJ
MANRPVHWHEGMFLRPHHFQTAQRHWFQTLSQGAKWDVHHNWGLRAIELDLDALANSRLVVRSLKARLRDGSLISVPEDGALPEVPLKGVFERERTLTVFLAVPIVNLGKANTAQNGTADGARYVVDTQELEDENTGINPQLIHVRLLNLKLLLSNQDHSGYEVLPVARIEKSDTAEGTPRLDTTYIPPLLACDAWKPLSAGILETIYDRIGTKLKELAQTVTSSGISFGSPAQQDAAMFGQLCILNEAYSFFGIQSFAPGVHPFASYIELSRLVGQLAIFKSEDPRPPELPKYDHDDLGYCFSQAKKYIDELLNRIIEPLYKKRDFVGDGLQSRVNLEPIWLESVWEMYVGAQSPLNTEECIRVLNADGKRPQPGRSLDVKIGSSDRVDELFKRGQGGLNLIYSPVPPRALPAPQGMVYFQVNRESQQQEWEFVKRSFTLAIRLNERLILGDIQNQRVLKIKHGTQTIPMQFALYLVPREK